MLPRGQQRWGGGGDGGVGDRWAVAAGFVNGSPLLLLT